MLNKFFKVLLSFALLLTVGTSFSENVNAQIMPVYDPFTDKGFTDGADPYDISWFGISSNYYRGVSNPSQIILSVVNDPILGYGNALNLHNPSFRGIDDSLPPPHFALGTFAPFNLPIGGRGYTLSFDFRFVTKPSSSTTPNQLPNYRVGGLRFGLYNSASTVVTTNILASLVGSGAPVEDDGGYLVSVGLAGFSSLEVSRENFNSGDSITGGSGGLSLSSNTLVPTIDDTVPHRATLFVQRTNLQTVQISATIDGYLVSATDSGPGIITSFDQVVVRSAFSDLDIDIDNVQIMQRIPLGTFREEKRE
ncbi:hypothetical protein [Nostoc commune]|uniref:hypothetical protein n=1 Tax=Nostoc commune TaxID=1178 RepID=UPI0018C51931|nr:hypothetical protein [Nostoc commune]MBG1263467.1 hypothetical protein [Nostoc commune BAE]